MSWRNWHLEIMLIYASLYARAAGEISCQSWERSVAVRALQQTEEPGGVEPPLVGGSDGGLRGVPFCLWAGVAVGAGLEGVGFAAGCVTGCELFKAKPGVGSKLIQP